MNLPGMRPLPHHPVHDMDSAVRRAIRDSPLGYFPSVHAEEHDPDDGLNDVARIDPASALPFEVMSAIFMHIYDAAPLLRRSDQIAHSVACVDRRWRGIVLESPRPWATVSVGHWPGCPSGYTSLALARSKEMPITVACISRLVDFLEEFMRLVLPHSARWRTLILSCPLVNWLDRISYCPHFESAFIDIVLPARWGHLPDFTFLEHAGNGRQIAVSCKGIHIHLALPASRFLDDLMVSIKNELQFPDLLVALKSLPNLQNLEFSYPLGWFIRSPASGEVMLSALTSLTVAVAGYLILDYLVAPALQTVTLRDEDLIHNCRRDFSRFIQRGVPFGMTLRRLEIVSRIDVGSSAWPRESIEAYLRDFDFTPEFSTTRYLI